jgi:4-aminobutyrate aminotransferase-like enzyme
VLAEFGRRTRYFNTFGGNPVSAAVGMAVLDVIEGEGLVANARDTGAFLRQALQDLAARHPAIGDIRGAGLFLGVELVRDRATREPDGALAARVVNGLRRRRVLVSSCGRHGNVLKLRPPLVFGREHAEILVAALDRTLADPDGA